ncbi:MAG: sporulation related protein [Betaproteobacteria bacterium]|nr:sporulation related protein [Betaproteobacteria bacterium]
MQIKRIAAGIALALCISPCTTALAAPTAVVEGVQMPAWVERAGAKQPLAPGMQLNAADKISTGQNSRLLLRLAEGSTVKLGENAMLSLDKLEQSKQNKQTFLSAALDVARGAFRFTTDAANKLNSKRDVNIRIATLTAGVRGTDLWGKSAGDRDVVCLIEGHIAVQREQDPVVDIAQPLQFYIAPKTADGKADRSKPEPQLAAVGEDQLKQWALETEIAAGQGAARKGGKFKFTAMKSADQNAAIKAYSDLRAAGYPAQIYPGVDAGKRSYEVRIPGLASKDDADNLAPKIEAITGVKPGA